ncbi:hypothetical protein [Jejuia spongiicola]|uniref:Uncharacterized protein n=1 Tax=Jejuia spongiicola TaxID=2942207 RepID=A0ABT0QJI6_9FLAO|nr:hypothetical protein [Jejuia spongiicola]MCL6296648.1 hypothetical protein [Jejuia spongiicola]
MKKAYITIVLIITSITAFAQYEYDVSETYPYGKANPNAPDQIKDFDTLIGECNCKSTSRKQDGTWNSTIDMIWRWKYIMNGMGVQDETLKVDGGHSGSIRQFIADSSKWYVHYYSSKSPSLTLSTWTGNKQANGNIVLYRKQKAPNGMDGFFRLTFYDITKIGYKWIGEWVDFSEKIVYPTWKIECKK